jgi:hypothetical protein
MTTSTRSTLAIHDIKLNRVENALVIYCTILFCTYKIYTEYFCHKHYVETFNIDGKNNIDAITLGVIILQCTDIPPYLYGYIFTYENDNVLLQKRIDFYLPKWRLVNVNNKKIKHNTIIAKYKQ